MPIKKKTASQRKNKQAQTAKNPKAAGKPTKFKPEYCEMLVEHMAEGYSYKTFAARVSVTYDTLFKWEKRFPEWAEAKARAKPVGEMFYEDLGLQGIRGDLPKFSAAAWIFVMKNRFDYTDKKEIETGDQGFKVVIEDYTSDPDA